MKYDELNALMIEFDRLRLDADRVIRKLRALGVTDLPGDEPRCLGTHTQPGFPVLPWKPSWQMISTARTELEDKGYLVPDGPVEAALSAAAAVAPKPAPGNLPGEPTEEMVAAAGDHLVDPRPMVEQALRAALAAAPRVEAEIPEVTEEDAQALCRASWGWAEDRHVSIPDTQATLVGLRAVRARLIARMGAKP